MDNNNGHEEISITQALNFVQSWINAKDYDKAIQGCQEILEIEPENKRALALMKQSEDLRLASHSNMPTPQAEPVIQEPEKSEIKLPKDILKDFHQVKNEPLVESSINGEKTLHKKEKRKLFLAMVLPALIVIILGSGLMWAFATKQRSDEINKAITEITTPADSTKKDRNAERKNTLTEIGKILEKYKKENGAYPSITQMENLILESDLFAVIPVDPKNNEKDADGLLFGYMYALYDDEYILSALLEDTNEKGSEWTYGAGAKNHSDFRDLSLDNVYLIGSKPASKPKVKVRRTSS